MLGRLLRTAAVCGVLLAHALNLFADERPGHWPQWRGPNRDNVATDAGLLQAWPSGGPPLAWRVEGLGEGIGSISVAGSRIFAVGYIDGVEYVTAVDEQSGRGLWAAPIGPAIGENRLMRWVAQRTPTVDESQLYVVRADGQLVCLAVADGGELWRRNLVADFQTRRLPWGFCDYPLVDGELLVCTPGGATATFAALDRRTGADIWTSLVIDGRQASYGAMIVTEASGVRQYVKFLNTALVGVSAKNGALLWRHDGIANGTANVYTPLALGDRLLCANGYGAGLLLLDLRNNAGRIAAHQNYFAKLDFNSFHDSTAVVGDSLYCFRGRGSRPTCIAWKTGAEAWTARPQGTGMAALTCADGRLYCRYSDGTMTLVEANPQEYVETGTFGIPDHAESIGATFPVVTGGRLYLRDDDRLFCYDVRQDATHPSGRGASTIVLPKPTAGAERTAGAVPRAPRPIFVPTPQDVVDRMLELADVDKDSHVVDLGSGDGRIVMAAAKKYGCHATGYEIDEELVKVSRERITAEGLSELAVIRQQDMFTADLSAVDVVAVYVYPSVLEKMKPQFAKLKPGARIVSHFFEIPGARAAQSAEIESAETGGKHRVFLYTCPLAASEGSD